MPPPLFVGLISFTRHFDPPLADERFRRGSEIEQGLSKAGGPELQDGKNYIVFATALGNDTYQVALFVAPDRKPPVDAFLRTATAASAYLLWQERADLTNELVWAAEDITKLG